MEPDQIAQVIRVDVARKLAAGAIPALAQPNKSRGQLKRLQRYPTTARHSFRRPPDPLPFEAFERAMADSLSNNSNDVLPSNENFVRQVDRLHRLDAVTSRRSKPNVETSRTRKSVPMSSIQRFVAEDSMFAMSKDKIYPSSSSASHRPCPPTLVKFHPPTSTRPRPPAMVNVRPPTSPGRRVQLKVKLHGTPLDAGRVNTAFTKQSAPKPKPSAPTVKKTTLSEYCRIPTSKRSKPTRNINSLDEYRGKKSTTKLSKNQISLNEYCGITPISKETIPTNKRIPLSEYSRTTPRALQTTPTDTKMKLREYCEATPTALQTKHIANVMENNTTVNQTTPIAGRSSLASLKSTKTTIVPVSKPSLTFSRNPYQTSTPMADFVANNLGKRTSSRVTATGFKLGSSNRSQVNTMKSSEQNNREFPHSSRRSSKSSTKSNKSFKSRHSQNSDILLTNVSESRTSIDFNSPSDASYFNTPEVTNSPSTISVSRKSRVVHAPSNVLRSNESGVTEQQTKVSREKPFNRSISDHLSWGELDESYIKPLTQDQHMMTDEHWSCVSQPIAGL